MDRIERHLEHQRLFDLAHRAEAVERVVADELVVRLFTGTAFAVTDRGTDLVNLSRFTLAGWVRASALTSGTSILELVEGTTTQLSASAVNE